MPRILLTGFMGCGKSVVGLKLAQLLQLPFCDLDEQIETVSEQPIPNIFRTQGESAFRKLESNVLQALPTSIVCALGGGTVLRQANLAWIRANGLLIYLKVRPEELQVRIEKDATIRPMLFGPNGKPLVGAGLICRITELLRDRAVVYEQADYTVEATALTPLETAQECARIAHQYAAT